MRAEKTLNEHLRDDPRTRGVTISFKFKNGKKAQGHQAFRIIEVRVNRKLVARKELTAAQSKSKRSKRLLIKNFILAGVAALPKKAPPKERAKAKPKKKALTTRIQDARKRIEKLKKEIEAFERGEEEEEDFKREEKEKAEKPLPPKKKKPTKKPTAEKILDPFKVRKTVPKDLKLIEDPSQTVSKRIYSVNLERNISIFKKHYGLSAPFRCEVGKVSSQVAALKKLVLEKALAFQKSRGASDKNIFLMRFSHTESVMGKAPRLSGWGIPRMTIKNEEQMRMAIDYLMSYYLKSLEIYLRGLRTIAITAFNIEADK